MAMDDQAETNNVGFEAKAKPKPNITAKSANFHPQTSPTTKVTYFQFHGTPLKLSFGSCAFLISAQKYEISYLLTVTVSLF